MVRADAANQHLVAAGGGERLGEAVGRAVVHDADAGLDVAVHGEAVAGLILHELGRGRRGRGEEEGGEQEGKLAGLHD